jgi:ABC-type nitrate/sulfonate/bicarbonate transport system substrate-binding protein
MRLASASWMNKSGWRVLAALASAAILVLAACSAGPTSSGATQGTATPRVNVPVKIAMNAGVNYSNLAASYAVKQGLLEKRGYKAELVLVPNDTTGVQGLLANSFQVLTQGASAALAAASQGADLVIIDSICPLIDYQFVVRSSINSLKELEGKTVGISSPGAISEQVPKLVLLNRGVDVSKIQFVAIGGDADRAKALTAAKIDGAVVNAVNTIAATKSDPSLKILADAGQELSKKFLNTAVVTTKSVATNQPQLVQDVLAAFLEATRIMQSDRAKTVDFAIQQGMPANAAGEAYDLLNRSGAYFPVNGGLDRDVFEFTVQSLILSGQLKPAAVRWDNTANTKFLEAALKELGPYSR